MSDNENRRVLRPRKVDPNKVQQTINRKRPEKKTKSRNVRVAPVETENSNSAQSEDNSRERVPVVSPAEPSTSGIVSVRSKLPKNPKYSASIIANNFIPNLEPDSEEDSPRPFNPNFAPKIKNSLQRFLELSPNLNTPRATSPGSLPLAIENNSGTPKASGSNHKVSLFPLRLSYIDRPSDSSEVPTTAHNSDSETETHSNSQNNVIHPDSAASSAERDESSTSKENSAERKNPFRRALEWSVKTIQKTVDKLTTPELETQVEPRRENNANDNITQELTNNAATNSNKNEATHDTPSHSSTHENHTEVSDATPSTSGTQSNALLYTPENKDPVQNPCGDWTNQWESLRQTPLDLNKSYYTLYRDTPEKSDSSTTSDIESESAEESEKQNTETTPSTARSMSQPTSSTSTSFSLFRPPTPPIRPPTPPEVIHYQQNIDPVQIKIELRKIKRKAAQRSEFWEDNRFFINFDFSGEKYHKTNFWDCETFNLGNTFFPQIYKKTKKMSTAIMPRYTAPRLTSQALKIFFRSFKQWGTSQGLGDDVLKMTLPMAFTDKEANMWFHLNDNFLRLHTNTYDNVVDFFLEDAPLRQDETCNVVQILSSKPQEGETLSSYVFRIRVALGEKFATYPEQNIVETLIANFPPNISDWIELSGKPVTFDALKKSIRDYERKHDTSLMNRQIKTEPSVSAIAFGPPPQTVSQETDLKGVISVLCRELAEMRTENEQKINELSAKIQTQNAQQQPQQQQNPRNNNDSSGNRKITCYYCGKPNHKANECRTREADNANYNSRPYQGRGGHGGYRGRGGRGGRGRGRSFYNSNHQQGYWVEDPQPQPNWGQVPALQYTAPQGPPNDQGSQMNQSGQQQGYAQQGNPQQNYYAKN